MTTNVPAPTFGATGFVAPDQATILAGVQADFQAAFGGKLNFTNQETPQGQLAASIAALVGNAYDAFVALANAVDPAFASGRTQDAIARIYFLTRIQSAPTALQITCTGLVGTVIPPNSVVTDSSGNQFMSNFAATIPVGGSIVVEFDAVINGPTSVPASVSIFQAVPGWDSAAVLSGTVGRNAETRSAFETRREESVAGNAVGSLPAVLGSVESVSGVTDAYVTENPNSTPLTVGGVVLNPNSLYVAAVGGTDLAVATAIWKKKAPGCNYTGNTTITVTDSNSGYVAPLPSYSVTFQRPVTLFITFTVTITNSALVPANAGTLVGNAIASASLGSDGGVRARIGSVVYASRYVAPVVALGSWAQIVSIKVGSPNVAASNFTASFSGTVMTVTAVAGGVLAVGQTINGATVQPGVTIVSLGTGAGGTGTYNLSANVTSPTGPGYIGYVASQDSVSTNINQAPSIVAANVTTVLV